MYTLDANIFVRDADPRDPDHALCHDLIDRLVAHNVVLIEPLIVIVEVAGTVSRIHRDPIRGRLAIDMMRSLPRIQFVVLDDLRAEEAALLAADYALRGADALYVAIARQRQTTLITLDREVHTRAAQIVPTRTPAEALAEIL